MKIWSNGCFDNGLHEGHLALLKYAKSLGDKLIIGIDGDERVKQMKGQDRPIRKQFQRAEDLYKTGYVSAVFVFSSDQQLIDTLHLVNPDIMVIGEEYKDKRIVGLEHVKEIVFFKKIEGYSTTEILKQQNGHK